MLELAARLRRLTPPALAAGLRTLGCDPVKIADFFDLAEWLIEPETIAAATRTLTRPELGVLRAVAEASGTGTALFAEVCKVLHVHGAGAEASTSAAEIRARLENTLLLFSHTDGENDDVYMHPRVRAYLQDGAQLPTLRELLAPPPPVLVSSDNVDRSILPRRAAHIAPASLPALAELLSALGTRPARGLSKGGLALPDARRLADTCGVDLDGLPALLARAANATLVAREGSFWLITPTGARWELMDLADKWADLATRWTARFPPGLPALLTRHPNNLSVARLRADAHWCLPLRGSQFAETLDTLLEEAESLGLTVGGEPPEFTQLVVAGDVTTATAALVEHFPEPVDRAYVQDDLTIIAPGPVSPALDVRLREVADAEGRGNAYSYRVTATSLSRGLSGGATVESIRQLFSEVSLTGIPQPLDYLIDEASRRFGVVRVMDATSEWSASLDPQPTVDASVRTVIHAPHDLLQILVVDSSLTPLELPLGPPGHLLSRTDPEVVFTALSSARYPVVVANASGGVQRREHRRIARMPPPTATTQADPIDALLDRLATNRDSERTEEDWLARTLDAAAKTKSTLIVTVRLSDGSSEYLLAPASVSNGRLRARDARSDIERTLPLSAIIAVRPPPGQAQ